MYDQRSRHVSPQTRAGELLAGAQSVADIVAALQQTARASIGSDGIAVVLRDRGSCHYVAEDAIEPLWRGSRFPLATCVSGWAMMSGRTAIVPDINLDARVPVAPYATKSIRSLIMAPIGAPEPVAALGAYWCALTALDSEIVARVEALAHAATQALNRVTEGSDVLERLASAG